jgi:hypothetical protein
MELGGEEVAGWGVELDTCSEGTVCEHYDGECSWSCWYGGCSPQGEVTIGPGISQWNLGRAGDGGKEVAEGLEEVEVLGLVVRRI